MKAKKWQLQEAKNEFNEVVYRATSEGLQTVTKHGKDSVIIVSVEDYEKIERPSGNLINFFRSSALTSIDRKPRQTKPRNIALCVTCWTHAVFENLPKQIQI